MTDEQTALRQELIAHQRRLAALRERAALQGYAVDPATRLEIEDIEQTIARLTAQPGDDSSPMSSPPIPQQRIPTGDTITATISGSTNVAVGKQINQQIGISDASDDHAALARAFDTLLLTLESSTPLDPAATIMARFQIGLVRGELLKQPGDGPPSVPAIIQCGDWLLANAPALATPLAALFAAPATRRLLEQHAPAAADWARQRFPTGL